MLRGMNGGGGWGIAHGEIGQEHEFSKRDEESFESVAQRSKSPCEKVSKSQGNVCENVQKSHLDEWPKKTKGESGQGKLNQA